MNKKTIVGVLIVIIGLGIVITYNYIYQDHRDIKTEQANFNTDSQSIGTEFSNNPMEAESKYLNKTVEISGIITEINETSITLDEVIFCAFSQPINTLVKVNSKTKIKGRVIGFDDLFEQVKLDQCSIVFPE